MNSELIALVTVAVHAALWVIRKDLSHDSQIRRLWEHVNYIESYLSKDGYHLRKDAPDRIPRVIRDNDKSDQ